jgi:Skp family chaperone for outer membrane proteins
MTVTRREARTPRARLAHRARLAQVLPSLIIAVTIVLVAGVLNFAVATSQPAGKSFRLATVTLKVLLEGLEENKALDAGLMKLREDSKAQVDALKKEIDAKRTELENYKGKKDSEEFIKMNLAFAEQTINARGRGESLEAAVDIRQGGNLKKIYTKILSAVESIAKQDGYDMVIVDDTGIAVPEVGGVKEISSPILSRQILYRDATIDLTDAVLTKMNSDYKSGRK